MANRQNFPNALYPIAGDVESQTGSPDVVVTGIQNTPFAADAPQTGQIPVMNSDGSWHPEDPVVSGTDAPGTPSTKNPVQVAGIDEGNLVRELRTDTYGGVRALVSEELLYDILLELRAVKAAILESNDLPDSDYAADNFSADGSVVRYADEESPSGNVDGVNKTFLLLHSPSPATSLQLFVNGILYEQGVGANYTLAGSVITMAVAPSVGWTILAWYRY